MENSGAKKGKFDKLEESSYLTRTMYLNAMKEFMTDTTSIGESHTNGDIEEYFRYEREVSDHIQEILKQCR